MGLGHETIELKDIALFTSRKETERKDNKEKVGRWRRGAVIMSAVATPGG